MAKLQVGLAANDFQFLPDLLDGGSGSVLVHTATTFSYASRVGVVTLTGAGFTYAGTVPQGGTIASLVVKNGGSQTLLQIDQVTQSLDQFYVDRFGSGGNGFQALSGLLAANDQLLGSAESDSIGGYSRGDDIVDGKESDDFIAGDQGNDNLNGGGGHDDLSYYQTFFDQSAKHGIKLNTASGIVQDPWGNTDHFVNFEFYEGSSFKDAMKGSSRDEEFRGLKGEDKIDGAGGFDRAIYSSDDQFRGRHGIKADLSTGEIKDGFGNTDAVKHIEAVRGTSHNDSFIGTNKNDEFQGLGGKDKYDAGRGFNSLDFTANDYNNGLHGANVDLAKHKGQVIDDGYGNKETAKGFEQVVGTRFGDTLQGDSHDNTLKGQDGNDFMAGRGGADTFVFNADPNSGSNHDTIGDFNAAEGDRIALRDGAFPAIATAAGNQLNPAEFIANAGGNPTSGNQHVVYDTSTGELFYDPDGNASSGDQVLIATLTAKPPLTAAVFDIWS